MAHGSLAAGDRTRRQIHVPGFGVRAAFLLGVGSVGGLVGLNFADGRRVDRIWRDLERTPPTGRTFSESLVADLPDPARRYFLHAIRPGTPLASKVHLTQTGSLLVGDTWAPFEAEEIMARPGGFAWKVRARIGGLPVTGSDYYVAGQGRMRMAALGLVPLVDESGTDLSRSAIGRLVVEYMWLPSAWLPQAGALVEPADDERFAVTVDVDGERTCLTLSVDANGRLTGSSFQRYGNITEDKHYQYIPFGGPNDEEGSFGGYTIPTSIRAGWWYGTDRYAEAFRFRVADARFD